MLRMGSQALESVGSAVKATGTTAVTAVKEAGISAADAIQAKIHTGHAQNASGKDQKPPPAATPRKMMMPEVTMDLKAFMLRAEVLKLYRHILRTLRDVPDATDRKQMQQFARQDFELNRHLKDDYAIKLALHNGRKSFERLSRNLVRTK